MRSYVKMKPSQNGENSPSFTNVGKSYPSRAFLTWQIYLLTLFAIFFAIISDFTVLYYFFTKRDTNKYVECVN